MGFTSWEKLARTVFYGTLPIDSTLAVPRTVFAHLPGCVPDRAADIPGIQGADASNPDHFHSDRNADHNDSGNPDNNASHGRALKRRDRHAHRSVEG